MKQKVMCTAWALYRAFEKKYLSFSDALRAAWVKIKLLRKLSKGKVAFSFLKKNGETRQAVGTSLALSNYKRKTNTERKQSPSLIFYWDLEKEAVRSFNVWQLI